MDTSDIMAAYKHRENHSVRSNVSSEMDRLSVEILTTSMDKTATDEERSERIRMLSVQLTSVIKQSAANMLSEIAAPVFETSEFDFGSQYRMNNTIDFTHDHTPK